MRRRLGLNQSDAAAKYRIREAVYRRWEKDQPTLRKGPSVDLTRVVLEPSEVLYLTRRRAGVRLKDAARASGVSHVTRIKQERPPSSRSEKTRS
jgi:hypothetical protein